MAEQPEEHPAWKSDPMGLDVPGVTSVEPGCTCGGTAACPQCQERDMRERVEKALYGILAWEPPEGETLDHYSKRVTEHVMQAIATMDEQQP